LSTCLSARPSDRPSLDPEVLEYFFSEARARIERFGEALGTAARPGARDALDDAFRHVHAIKGAASTVGLSSIARGAHALEGALLALKARASDPSAAEIDVLATARAHLAVALATPATAPAEIDALVALLRGAGLVREHDLQPVSQLPQDRARQTPALDAIRVPVAAVAQLAESVGEVGFVSDRMALHGVAMREFARLLADAARSVEQALQRIGPPRPWGAPADALERLASVSREIAHASGDLDREGECLGRDAEVLGALAGGARESLARLEGTTVRWLFERVAPAAETLARREGKELLVVRHGEAVEIARGLAERLVEPLAQLARNAVTHGVEPPASRLARGKPARATLRFAARVERDRLSLVVEDDGAGVDLEGVRQRARALGLLREAEAQDPGAVLATLFLPGVSTRVVVDAAAGRGVGLDLVHREIAQVGGSIAVTSRRGEFTRFEIEIPMRPLAQRVLVVRAGGERVALPLERVTRVVACAEEAGGAPVVDLALVMGAAPAAGAAPGACMVLLQSVAGPLGAIVDAVERAREFVVRPLPPLLAGLRPWAAATVDGEGRAMLVVDVDQLRVG
jgi:two-component system chemotaxis sensor kinase CheA